MLGADLPCNEMIDPCHALCSDFRLKFAFLFKSCLRAKLKCHQVLRTLADPVRNISPRHDEVRAIVTAPPDDKVSMRPTRVMVDCADPFQPRVEIGFHLRNEVANERFEVCHFGAVFGRDNEPEMMPVFGNGFDEIRRVGIFAQGIKQLPAIFLLKGYVAADVTDMRGQCRHARS